ncbi:MAG: hypothetical protein CMO98_08510 [Woeseia sp.]|nr:hypothetical protein [Woeseia sp.]|tara:strand:+ start:1106 stop:2419 length:1314 start_codon:yes stop_codon:yes gene_type:complete
MALDRDKGSIYKFFKVFVTLLYLVSPQMNVSLFANELPHTAAQLLESFSGRDAANYEPFFRFSEKSRITSVEIHAVGMENTAARYSGQEGTYKEVNNILRINTADGFEGISGVDTYYLENFNDEHLLELASVAQELVSLNSLDPVEVLKILVKTRPDLSDGARASIDISLWDLASKKADRPLYEFLGSKRDSIEPYASLPFYESLPEHIEAVQQYAKLGYRIFKFHVWGSIEEDMQLVKLVQQTFADSPYRFMIDLEGVYDIEDALRLGRKMDEGLFIWLEGPIDDQLLLQSAELRRKLTTHIIPVGYKIYSPEFIRQGIEAESWDAGRFDVTVVGGVTKSLQLLRIANDAELTIDIQSWGHSLGQAVNLHLMLANERTRYFEAPMPKDVFEFGMKNGNLLKEGRVRAPHGTGLGIDVDWEHLTTADFYVTSRLIFQ